jgi:hypothetical protein
MSPEFPEFKDVQQPSTARIAASKAGAIADMYDVADPTAARPYRLPLVKHLHNIGKAIASTLLG